MTQLTDQQIRDTVAQMKMADTFKKALLKQAIELKDASARFVVYAAWKRQNAAFTPDQLRAGYARNARGLATMLAKAERTGRKVNGFTADYLRAKVATYEALSRVS